MADSKSWKLALGDRGTPSSDPITEMVRANMAKKQQKEIEREDELEELKHKAKTIELDKEIKGEEKAKMAELEKENKGLQADIQKKEIDRVEQSLGSKVDKLTESIAGSVKQQTGIVVKGEFDIREGEKRAMEEATREREARQAEQERREKAEREIQLQTYNALQKQMDTLTETVKGGQKPPAEELKKYLELRDTFEQAFAPKQSEQSLPAETQLEIKKMDNNLQIQLEEMRDARSRRDNEWKLTVRKWDEEKLMRQQELDAKITGEREKLDTIKTIGDRFVGAVVGGLMEGSGETPAIASRPEKKYTIDAGESEEGEFNCPKCNSVVGIAADTVTAICANCGMKFPIRRVAPKGKIPAAQGEAESKQTEEEQAKSPEYAGTEET